MLDLAPSATVFVKGKCADCAGPLCPVCKGKGEALAVFTVEQITEMAIAAALAQAQSEARKAKIARLN